VLRKKRRRAVLVFITRLVFLIELVQLVQNVLYKVGLVFLVVELPLRLGLDERFEVLEELLNALVYHDLQPFRELHGFVLFQPGVAP